MRLKNVPWAVLRVFGRRRVTPCCVLFFHDGHAVSAWKVEQVTAFVVHMYARYFRVFATMPRCIFFVQLPHPSLCSIIYLLLSLTFFPLILSFFPTQPGDRRIFYATDIAGQAPVPPLQMIT